MGAYAAKRKMSATFLLCLAQNYQFFGHHNQPATGYISQRGVVVVVGTKLSGPVGVLSGFGVPGSLQYCILLSPHKVKKKLVKTGAYETNMQTRTGGTSTFAIANRGPMLVVTRN